MNAYHTERHCAAFSMQTTFLCVVFLLLTFKLPEVITMQFLLTTSIHFQLTDDENRQTYQPEGIICLDITPNSLSKFTTKYMASRKENY